jgi:hypothetical protein
VLLEIPERIELPLMPSLMQRVFFNLIANAVEAMPTGGKLRISARKTVNHVLVEVEHTGPGIPGAIRDRLFEPFITAGKQDGLGLGLAFSRQTLLNHGGDIWTEPAIGARLLSACCCIRTKPCAFAIVPYFDGSSSLAPSSCRRHRSPIMQEQSLFASFSFRRQLFSEMRRQRSIELR